MQCRNGLCIGILVYSSAFIKFDLMCIVKINISLISLYESFILVIKC